MQRSNYLDQMGKMYIKLFHITIFWRVAEVSDIRKGSQRSDWLHYCFRKGCIL